MTISGAAAVSAFAAAHDSAATAGRSLPRTASNPTCRGVEACRAKKDAQVLAFFRSHPRLARTPEGQRQVLAALLRRVGRLEAQVRSLQAARSTPQGAIRHVFGEYAEEALQVAWCESRYDVNATNGMYRGLFQMGDYARGRYGHGADALTQARAAWAYFADAGYDWSPWSCRPW